MSPEPSLFVIPIAVVGLQTLPMGSNLDLIVLTAPLSQGQDALVILSFFGGFSSATSMLIWVRAMGGRASVSGDVRHVVLLGYLNFRLSGGGLR